MARMTYQEELKEEAEQYDNLLKVADHFSTHYGFLDAARGIYAQDYVGVTLTPRVQEAAGWIRNIMNSGDMPLSWLLYNMTAKELAGIVATAAYQYQCTSEARAHWYFKNLYNLSGLSWAAEGKELPDYCRASYIIDVSEDLQALATWRATHNAYSCEAMAAIGK